MLSNITQVFTRDSIAIGNSTFSILEIVQVSLLVALLFAVTRWLRHFLKSQLLVKFGIDRSNRVAIATVVSYGTGSLGALTLLQAWGFDLSSIAVIAGALGVGIGFGLQNLANNFISGLTLLLERKLQVGDFVEFDGLSGYIKEVFLQSTVIRTREGADVVVPNSQLVSNRIVNWSYDNCYVARVHIPVGVAYGSDPVLVTEILLTCAYMEPAVVFEPPPRVLLMGFGDSALQFELWVWVDRIDLSPFIVSSLNFLIEYHLRSRGVKIPFPQQEVWLNSPRQAIDWNRPPFGSPPETEETTPGLPNPLAGVSLRRALQKIPYFEGFNELQQRQLIESGVRQLLSPGDILFQEGDLGNSFYIVVSGKVEVYLEHLERRLSVLEAGAFFGELALMLNIPRTASVRALEPTILFVLERPQFETLLRQYPNLYDVILASLENHKAEFAQRQEELRALGLLDETEVDLNPLAWVRSRLKALFGSSNSRSRPVSLDTSGKPRP